MYAAHFAAGLAIKSRAPTAPTWALLTAAFLPDFVWIGLAAVGVEPANGKLFFDEWSHSLVSIMVEASVFAAAFWRSELAVWAPIWLAGASHFILDLPIHPRPLALYPHSAIHAGWDLWAWGQTKSALGQSNYWWIQLAMVLVLLAIYASGARKAAIPANIAAATCLAVFGLHLLF